MDQSVARALENPAVRGFKALLVATVGTAALTALGLGVAHALGNAPDTLPSAVMGFITVVHFAHERLSGIAVGRGRLGVPDRMARELARDVAALVRREPDGAWVSLESKGLRVRVLDRPAYEELAARIARSGGTMRLLRSDGDGYVVERYEGGVLRSDFRVDGTDSAIRAYDERGRPTRSSDVRAPAPSEAARGAGVTFTGDGRPIPVRPMPVERTAATRRKDVPRPALAGLAKEGTDLSAALADALSRGPVHVRSGAGWTAVTATDASGTPMGERAYARARATGRDHVEVERTWDGASLSRLTRSRLDSCAHGGPARLSFDADGATTGVEWFVEGRPSDEEGVREARASYAWSPTP